MPKPTIHRFVSPDNDRLKYILTDLRGRQFIFDAEHIPVPTIEWLFENEDARPGFAANRYSKVNIFSVIPIEILGPTIINAAGKVGA